MIFNFIAVNHNLIKPATVVYLDIFLKSSTSQCCLFFAYFSLALFMKVLVVKKACNWNIGEFLYDLNCSSIKKICIRSNIFDD